MKRLLCSLMLAMSFLTMFMPTALIPAAHAADEWCEDDPPLAIQTLGGDRVVVHVTNFAQLSGDAHHDRAIRKALADAEIWYVKGERRPEKRLNAKGVMVEGTSVPVYVRVPAAAGYGGFPIQSMVGSKPRTGDLAARTTGSYLSGHDVIKMTIWLPNK